MVKSKNSVRKDLLRYYKYVFRCPNPACQRLYGTDTIRKIKLCPVCVNKCNEEGSMFTSNTYYLLNRRIKG